MTRRQLLIAAALAGATSCSSNDKATTRDEPALDPPGLPTVGACGSQSENNPEDWYKPHLAPTLYLIDPHGQDIDLELPEITSVAKDRVNVHALDASAKDLLNMGYAALAEDLPSTVIMKTKASIGLQALIHNRYCAIPGHGVHRSDGGLFFAWHRAFLVFHERLLQWKLKERGVDATTANNFRLPYWDPREDFGVYGDATRSGLFRMRGPTTETAPKLTVADCMQTDLKVFGDRVLAWHGEVHNWMCGQFQQAKFSGFDPLFYAFHAYVDFIWESSPVKGQIGVDGNPGTKNIDPWWATFFDAERAEDPAVSSPGMRGWSKVNVNNFSDTTQWGYSYPGTAMCDPNSPGLEFTNIDLPSSDDQVFRLVVRDLQNADVEKEIATIRPFGHVHKSYPFVRAYLPLDQAREYAKAERWGFWIRANYEQKPVSLRVTAIPVLAAP
jgi:hypothetical protein